MSRTPSPNVRTVPIPWRAQPSWARFAAMDRYGWWWVFKHCPVPSGGEWVADESFDAAGQPLHMADMKRQPKWSPPEGAGESARNRAWRDWRAAWPDSLRSRAADCRNAGGSAGQPWEPDMLARKTFGGDSRLEVEIGSDRIASGKEPLTLLRLRDLGGTRWTVTDTGDGVQIILRGEASRKTFLSALAFALNAGG